MKRTNPISNEKGVALITVVLLFLILVIMLGSAMFAAVTNQRNSILASEHSEAYYVAESGINLRVSQITDFLKDPGGYSDFDPKITSMVEYLESMVIDFNLDPNVSFGNGNSAYITIEGPEDSSDFFDSSVIRIISTGTVNGVSRTLEQDMIVTVTFGDKSKIDKAIISRGSVIMNEGNGTVRGAILSNGEPLKVIYKNAEVTGPVFELSDVSVSNTNNACKNISAYGWPEGLMPAWQNITFWSPQGNLADKKINGDTFNLHKNNCFYGTKPLEEPAKIFPAVVVPNFPQNPLPVKVEGGVIKLQDLRRIKDLAGNSYDGYKIMGNLEIKSSLTVDLGSFGYSTQLKKIIVEGDFDTTSQGELKVIGSGRLVFMKYYETRSIPRTLEWSASVNKDSDDPAKVIFMFDTHDSLLPAVDGNESVTASFAKPNVLTFSIDNSAVFNASLIGENVNYEWKNATVKGYIITNGDTVTLSANAKSEAGIPVWIYAPVAHVSLASGTVLYGSVLSKAVEMTGQNTKVLYEDMPPGAAFLTFLFYLQPTTGTGTNPDQAKIYFSNIFEIDN